MGMEFEIAELPLDHQYSGLHIDGLHRDIGQGLDIETRRHFDDDRRHVGSRQEPPAEGAQMAHGARLQLVNENIGAKLGHQRAVSPFSSSRMMRRISARISSESPDGA